jgi:hypothetical protein
MVCAPDIAHARTCGPAPLGAATLRHRPCGLPAAKNNTLARPDKPDVAALPILITSPAQDLEPLPALR